MAKYTACGLNSLTWRDCCKRRPYAIFLRLDSRVKRLRPLINTRSRERWGKLKSLLTLKLSLIAGFVKYMPQLTTAVSLLLGLGARIAYNKFFTFRAPGIEDHVLSGLWQGVALYHVLMEFPNITLPVGFGIGARLLVNFVVTYDAAGCACTLLGVAVGVLFTDILSQVLEDGDPEDAYYEGSVVSDYPRRRRLVQLRTPYGDDRIRDHNRRRRAFLEAEPSVTTAITNTTNTWDSLSDWIDPNHTMSPLEREVAALRKKASMADSERRRFKEEKQWAQVQGNKARAAQMGWQVKRYSALMQSFHREADLRLLEGP